MPDELYLIDGNSLVYRAFFALPQELATSAGAPTGAIFGFASMLVKILTDHGQKRTLVVWDTPGMSGRKQLYPEYKSQRAARPDLLRQQWPHLEPLVEAFGYSNVSVPGYEADDVIATLAERAKREGIAVVIVTGDRDSFQLVGDGVTVLATSRGITDTKSYDREAVIERYGIPPELIPDFYGLKGDSSDNIPGVPGIGEKIAAQLLNEYGSLEAVLEHAQEVPGAKRRQSLVEHAEDALLSKRLATAQRDVPIEIDLRAESAGEPDRSRLREVFREFELRDPLRRLEEALGEEAAAPRPVAAAPAARVRAGTLAQIAALEPAAEPLALALRGREVPEGALFAESQELRFAAYAGGEALSGECEGAAELVAALGARPAIVHDAKSLGVVPQRLAHDTMVAAYLLDPARRSYPLGEICDDRGLGTTLDDPAADDALRTWELARAQRGELAELGLEPLFDDIELPLVGVLRAMELAGLWLDTERLGGISETVRADIAALEREIWELAGEQFTIGSPQQLARILFEKLGLSRKRRRKTGFSTDARVLQAIRDEHPIVERVERWRELTKLRSTYLDALPTLTGPDGRVHTTLRQTIAATGRLSSTSPNLQNIPVRTALGREIRACFAAEPGNALLALDYSQVELRVLAHVADEPVLKEIFRAGEDVHTATAELVFGIEGAGQDHAMRSKAKMVNYGIVYGLSAYGLADRLAIGNQEAQDFIDRYLERFPAVRRFIEETVESAREQGYVTTMFGRRRAIPELRANAVTTRQLGERLAVNTVIQGSAADIIKIAMLRCHDALAAAGLRTRLVLQIHDELLFEGPRSELEQAQAIGIEQMVGACEELDPPLVVDAGTGANWSETK